MNARTHMIQAFIRVTRRQIPVQLLFNLLQENLLDRGLGLDLRYNCRYREEELLEALIYSSLTRLALELGCDRLRMLGCMAPTGHTVRDKLRAKTVGQAEEEVSRLIQGMARVVDGPVTLAVDLHKNPYYGDRRDPYVVGGRRKQGTTKFHAYATAYTVREGMRFTLAAYMVKPGEKPHHILERLLDRVEEIVEVERVLADAGFYSVPCIRLLEAGGLRYTIHGEVKGKRIKRMLDEVEHLLPEKGDSLSLGEYKLSGKYGEAGVRLLAARVLEEKPLHIFAVPLDESRGAKSVYGEFEHRFSIETSYRMIGKVKAWTTSKSPALRAYLFGVAVLLYNLWILAKIRLQEQEAEGAEGAPGRRKLRMRMFTGLIRLALELKALIKEVI